MPELITSKSWSVYPFIPVIISGVVLLLARRLTVILASRLEDELGEYGISLPHQKRRATNAALALALQLQFWGGLLPVLGSFIIAAVSVKPMESLVLVYFVVAIVSFVPLTVTFSRLEDLYAEFNKNFPTERIAWYERIVRKWFPSYGSLITDCSMSIVVLIQLVTAYILLPTSVTTPTSIPTP